MLADLAAFPERLPLKGRCAQLFSAACLTLFLGAPHAEPFTFAVIGDPQFTWTCKDDEQYKPGQWKSTYCSSPNLPDPETPEQAEQTNQAIVDRVGKLSDAQGAKFKGLIVNGDLTRFGAKDDNLGRFEKMYVEQTRFPVWPGLGNHDYQNNIDDCGGGNMAPTRNNCAAGMLQFLAEWLQDSGRNGQVSYDITRYSKNPGQAQGQRNISGSLAYSWEVGDFHFVQLNNYPTYKTHFTRGYDSGISSWDLDITSPADWLDQDLSRAVIKKKVIVLNWHMFDPYANQDLSNREYGKLIAMLDKYAGNIKAIFIAHEHSRIGIAAEEKDRLYLKFPQSSNHIDDISVPVIYSGSPIWGRFIKADFDSQDKGLGCSITITQIDVPPGPERTPVRLNCSGLNDDARYELDFGGAYGYIQGQPGDNSVTGQRSCPPDYKTMQVYGASGTDYPVSLCYRSAIRRDPDYPMTGDFGGMWGYVDGIATLNPLTSQSSCPSGFADLKVSGTDNVDWDLHMCYRGASANPPMKFGGVLGYVDGKPVPNQVTENSSCPPGYAMQAVLGQKNVDWPFAYCYAMAPRRLDFGGAFGYVNNGAAAVNPVTNDRSCPAGYSSMQAYGSPGVDWPVNICYREHQEGRDPDYDFGGMWGYINDGQLVPNPITGQAGCMEGYIDIQLLGTTNQDWPLHACYRRHISGDNNGVLWFGGVLGTVNGAPVGNPATGTYSCPPGHDVSKVLGTANRDWDLSYCYLYP